MIEVYARNGRVILRKGLVESVVASGTQPKLIFAESTMLWWVDNASLKSATVNEDDLSIRSVQLVTDAVVAYSAKFIPDTGFVWIATDGASVSSQVGDGPVKTTTANLDSLSGIDVEIDPSGKTIVTSAIATKQTEQGFVQQFVQAANKVIDQFFVYDYTLGPQDLPEVLAALWS